MTTASPFAEDAVGLQPARRREFAHAAPGSFRLQGETDSRWRDMLFAASVTASVSGLRAPGLHTPVFVLFALAVALASYRSLARLQVSARLFVPPLAVFMVIHLTSAFRLGRSNGQIFVFQAVIVSVFVAAFTIRYSQVSMRRFYTYCGIGLTGLLIYILGWHFAKGRFFSFKFIPDAKAVFDLIPIMLLVLRRSGTPRARTLFLISAPILTVIVLLSGERKAYILLALFAPFLINWRSPVTYILPLIIGLAAPAALTFDKYGYVARQLGTLASFGEGRVAETRSNEQREWAIDYALRLAHDHPVDGVGTNAYTTIVWRHYGKGMGTHNEWMRVLAENGIVGLIFYAATVIFGLIGLFRRRTWGRPRPRNEMLIGFALFTTVVMYLSFEAIDFIVIMAFLFAPMVQFLRLDPRRGEMASSARRDGGLARFPSAPVAPPPAPSLALSTVGPDAEETR